MRTDPGSGSGGDWTGQRAQGGVDSVRYEEFIERARRQAGLGSSSEAETVVRATLTALGEYLDEEPDLVSHLPEEIAECMRREPSGRIVSSSLDAFMEEVGKREGANTDEASSHARAVVDVLREAIGQDEVEDLRRRLPNELGPLFD